MMLSLTSLVLSQAASASVAVPTTTDTVLGISDIIRAAERERSRKGANRTFAPTVRDVEIDGLQFKVHLPLFKAFTGIGLQGDGMAGSWNYDRVKQLLVLRANTVMWPEVTMFMRDFSTYGIDGFYLNYHAVARSHYLARNAFGAKASITKYSTGGVAIAYPRKSNDDLSGLPSPHDGWTFSYTASIPVSPERAQEITKSIMFVVEGKLSSFLDGSLIRCGHIDGRPTMISRMDVPTDFCVVAADVSRVAFVYDRDQVLKEWSERGSR